MSISRKQFLRNAGLLLGGTTLLGQNIFAANKIRKPPACTDLAAWFGTFDLTDEGDLPFAGSEIVGPVQRTYYKQANGAYNCTDKTYADENNGCEPGTASCDHGATTSLTYDVYYPDPEVHNYETCPLPAIVYVHGGGFSDCSNMSNAGVCNEYAKRGFCVFNIEYRRGKKNDNDDTLTSAANELAVYRGCQDVRGVIRHVIENYSNSGNEYKIAPYYIFVAGESAGSVAVLNAIYYPTSENITGEGLNNNIFPNKSGTDTIVQALGSMDANYYDLSNRDSSYIEHIAGVLNLWGAIYLPLDAIDDESNFFQSTENTYFPPVISFCGALDDVFDYEKQSTKFSPSGNNNNEVTTCLNVSSFKTEDVASNTDLKTYGLKFFHEKVLDTLSVDLSNEIFRELYIDSDMGHNMSLETDGPLRYWGTDLTTDDDAKDYIVKRASTFFQAIITGTANSLKNNSNIKKTFIDCCNVRKKNQTNNHNCETSDCPPI